LISSISPLASLYAEYEGNAPFLKQIDWLRDVKAFTALRRARGMYFYA
jgi:hypothetical protein